MADDAQGDAPRRACLNCEAELSGDYCSACGQRDLPSRLAIGELLREVLSETLELDGRVWRTVWPFLTKPGVLTREYVAGRRVRYTSPFRLFLAATLLWLATSFIVAQRGDFELEPSDPSAEPGEFSLGLTSDGEEPTRLETWLNERGQALEQMSNEERSQLFWAAARETLPKSVLLTIPIFALLLKLLFIRQDRYYVEHLVFALHVHAFAFLILAIAILVEDDLIETFFSLAILAYIYFGLKEAYEARWWTSGLRLVTLIFVHGFILVITTMLMVLLAMLMG